MPLRPRRFPDRSGIAAMAMWRVTLLAVLLVATPVASADTNPLAKVIELLDGLAAKITKEGDAEQKADEEHIEWCDDFTKEKAFEIKSLTTKKEELEATISKCTSDIEGCDGKIEELVADTATGEAELKNATLNREKEKADFEVGEAVLVDSIDVLDRAIAILGRDGQESGPRAGLLHERQGLATLHDCGDQCRGVVLEHGPEEVDCSCAVARAGLVR